MKQLGLIQIGHVVSARNRNSAANLLRFVFALLSMLLYCSDGSGQVVSRVSSPGKFYVDDKQGVGIIYNYAVYSISNNTASAFPGVYVAITNIASTNRIQLTPTDNGVRALGSLAVGETKLAAFYLRGPGFTGNSDSLFGLTNETHAIRVLNGPPGVGSILASQTYSFTNILFVIEALANKVTVITNLNPYAMLGSEVPLVITGDTGTIGGDNSISFSPAVLGSWRPDCYELVRTIVKFTQNPTFTNQVYFDPNIAGFTNYGGQSYTNTFIFRAVKPTGTNIAISPFAFIDSGANTKHTSFNSLANSGGSNVIYSVTNVISISSQTVSTNFFYAPGGTVMYSITFSNFGPETLSLDEVIDQLPATPGNASYVPGSATFNAAPLVDPVIVGQALHWAQPFTLLSNSTTVLTFQAVIPAPGGQYTNSVTALIGPTQIDSTTDTTDDNPSRSVVTVIPVSDLAAGKSAPTSVNAAANFNYTISVTNFGPSPTTLSVTDNLPAQVSFVSTIPTATLNGSQVVWNLGTLASNAVTNLTITVAAPAEADSLTNAASAGSSTIDFTFANNFAPPVFTSVSPLADLAISKTAGAPVLPGSNFTYTITVTNIGPSTATSVTVTDALPANVSFVSASDGGVFNGANVVWPNLGNLVGGASTNLTITVTAPINGGITNTASASSSITDPVPGNNSTPPVISVVSNLSPLALDDSASTPRNVTVTIPVLANDSDPNGDALTLLAVTQTNGTANVSGTNVVFAPATNFLGSVILTYTVIDNNGGTNSALIDINVTNRPPVAVNDSVFGSNSVAQVIYPLDNDSDPDGDSLIIVSATATSGILVINSGNTNLTFTPTNTTTVVITYTIADDFGGTNSATITVIGQNTPPIANDDSASTPANVPLLISPLGNDSDVDGDPLTIISAFATNGTAIIENSTNFLFTPDTNFDGTATVLYTVSDGLGGTASALVTINVTSVADLAVSKSAPASVNAAENLDYTITITNIGPSTASSLSVTDALPAGVTFVSASSGGMLDGSVVVWTLDGLAANASTNLTLTVTVPASGNLTNFASVGSPTSDPNSTNNLTLPVFTTVTPVADVQLTKIGPDAPVLPGFNFAYTIVVTNVGPSTATSLVVTDALPAEVTFVSASGNGALNGGEVIWLIGDLAANESTNLTLTVTAPFRGSVTNIASVGGPTFDPNPTNGISTPVTSAISNLPPVAVNDTATTTKNVPVSVPVLANDSDPNGDPLTVILAIPSSGSASINAMNVLFTPATGFTGIATVTYTIIDGSGGTNSATISVTVNNIAPVANNDSFTTPEDSTLNIPAAGVLTNDFDADGDALTSLLVANVIHGSLLLNADGSFSYTPNTNYHGADVFSYIAADGQATSTVATVTINITDVNDAPVANDQNVVTLEDIATNIVLTASDADGDSLTFTVLANPSHGAIGGFNPNSGTLIYTPSTNYNGVDSFSFTVSDGSLMATGTVLITVSPVNDAPVANNQGVTTPEDISTNLVLTASDADGDTLTFTVLANPLHGTISGFNSTTGNLTYTPSTNYNGPDSFTFTVNDGGLTATGTVSVIVTPVNDTPATSNDVYSTLKNVPLNISAPGVLGNDTDVENDSLSALLVTTATNGTLTLNANGSFLYTPNSNYIGSDVFTYRAYDADATGNVATVTINVGATNTPPTANDDSFSTLEDTTLNIPAAGVLTNDVDIDGDSISAVLISTTIHGALTLNSNGSFSYTPNPNYNGSDSFTYRASDSQATSGVASVTITVTATNDAPIANNQSVVTLEDVSTNLVVTGNDVDSTTLTYAILVGPTQGSLSNLNATNGTITYTPSTNYNGPDSFSFTVSDGSLMATGTVSIMVAPVNDAPVSVDDAYGTFKNVALSISASGVLGNDTDVENDSLSAVLVATTTNGALTLNPNGSFLYTPNSNYVGSDVFTYRAYDAGATGNVAIVTINVAATNIVPVANAQSVSTPEHTAKSITLTGGDLDGDTLTFNIATAPANGTLSGFNTNTGAITYTPNVGFLGADSFTFFVNDGTTNSEPATVTLTVVPQADLAVFKSGPTNVTPGQNFAFTVTVTNFGPSSASNVVVQDFFPTNLTFISASSGGTFAADVITWPTITSLAVGAATNITVNATATALGTFTNVAAGTSTTPDPDPANNDGSSSDGRVAGEVSSPSFGILKGPNVLNPQTGLYEQRVTVTNTAASTVAAFQLLVGNINGTNGVPRTNVTLVNATGTNVDSRPYVQYNSPLNPGANVTLILEFFVPDRKPFTNSLEVVAVLPSSLGTNATAGVAIDRAFVDSRFTPNRFVLEWTAVPGKTYTIIYSEVGPGGPWLVATPTVTAPNNRVQWYDDGPPKTVSAPMSGTNRFYRVIANP